MTIRNIFKTTYNGLGNRLQQIQDGQTTTYALDLNAGLPQVLSDGTYTYLYGYDRIAQSGASGMEYFLPDGQMTDGVGGVTLSQSFTPYGELLARGGIGSTVYDFAGEWKDPSGLQYLRARYYAPNTGTFISRDPWSGNVRQPVSLNRYMYVQGNPVNYVDPFGLWEIAPGYDLSNGGIYGEGMLRISNSYTISPEKCTSTSVNMPIFVPQKGENGILYNDIMFQSPKSYSYNNYDLGFGRNMIISIITDWYKYDIFERNSLECFINEIMVPTNTDVWETISQTGINSMAFSRGFLTDLSVFVAIGIGYDAGYVPLGVQMGPESYYSQNLSIAIQLMMAQSDEERSRFNVANIFESSTQKDLYEAGVSGVVFAMQGWQGAIAYNSRAVTVIVQRHNRLQNFCRAIIETTSAYQEVKSNRVLIISSFLSFKNNKWQEDAFNVSTSRIR